MKKFLFVVTFSLSTLIVAETPTHTTPADASTGISTPVRSTVASQDKAAKLVQYINACMVKRPGADDEIRKLLQ